MLSDGRMLKRQIFKSARWVVSTLSFRTPRPLTSCSGSDVRMLERYVKTLSKRLEAWKSPRKDSPGRIHLVHANS